MARAAANVTLTATQAACLEVLGKGPSGKTAVAVETRLDLRTVADALAALSRAGLIARGGGFRWGMTERGRSCAVRVAKDPERRLGGKRFGRPVAGSAALRLIEMLDRPMRGEELAERLGVTKQRVHQLVVRLHAQGRLKLGDPGKVLHLVARSDDRSVLLTRDEERILSALPDEGATSAARLAARTHVPPERVTGALSSLRGKGLIEKAGSRRSHALFSLRLEGHRHFQRRASPRRAESMPPPVRSDRVRDVLSFIDQGGGVRIRDVGAALAIPHPSMNALMQYLKRKGLVRKRGRGRTAPYELSGEGRDALAELARRSR